MPFYVAIQRITKRLAISMFCILAALSQSKYIEIDDKSFSSVIGGPKPVMVKFYSPNCGHCKAMAPDFEEASQMFTDTGADFGGINCIDHHDLCDKYKVSGYPTLKLFLAGKTDGKEYDGDRSADSFADFIQSNTGIKAKRPPRALVELNSVNFEKALTSHQCSLVTFYSPHCPHCKHFLPTAKSIALSFVPETNVSVAALDCIAYDELCNKQGIHGFPTIVLFKGEQNFTYSGNRSPDDVAKFINTNCGTQRGSDGLLIDTVGLVDGTQPIIAEFLTAQDKKPIIEKMKAIKGAEFYVKVMERIVAKGLEAVGKDVETMNEILVARKGSISSLDGVKARFNVFAQFLPKKAEEKVVEPNPAAQPAQPPKAERANL